LRHVDRFARHSVCQDHTQPLQGRDREDNTPEQERRVARAHHIITHIRSA